MSWLARLAAADECSLPEAAALLGEVATGGVDARSWRSLTKHERALVLVALRNRRAKERSERLSDNSQHMAAAMALEPIDGGVAAARRLAFEAGQAFMAKRRAASVDSLVASALKRQRRLADLPPDVAEAAQRVWSEHA